MAVDTLTGDQRAILDLEAKWFTTSGGKDSAIRELGMTPIRYYQRLARLIESEAALECSPGVVNRLRRISFRPRSS